MFSCLTKGFSPKYLLFLLPFMVGVWAVPPGSQAELTSLTGARKVPGLSGQTTVFVEANTTTWKTRGRLMYDVEGAVRLALGSAGFEVVRKNNEPHALTVSLEYTETKGEPYAINQFGTDIAGRFIVSHHEYGPLFQIYIQESTHPKVSGTPPYLDTLYNFQANPYYYFLGEIVWAKTQYDREVHTVFILALRKILDNSREETIHRMEAGHQPAMDFSQPFSRKVFAPMAIRRVIDEFVFTHDQSIVPLLMDFLNFPDQTVRVRSIEALGELQVMTALPHLHRLLEMGPEIVVQEAAQKTIQQLTQVRP